MLLNNNHLIKSYILNNNIEYNCPDVHNSRCILSIIKHKFFNKNCQ